MNEIKEQLEQIAEDFCNNYCKYPGIWDEEKRRHRTERKRHLRKLPDVENLGGNA